MKIAVLAENGKVSVWQRNALLGVAADHHLFLIKCPPAPAPRRKFKYAAYYALNIAAVRNRLTKKVPAESAGLRYEGQTFFEPDFEGAWALLPKSLLTWLRQHEVDVVVKFGLGLLRVPAEADLPIPILSFHHGDPRAYRGRPAGFYEMLHRKAFVGQVVQVLSNRLDQGEVLAFGETRVVPHSYRETLIAAFSLSQTLLRKALHAFSSGEKVDLEPEGPLYRLPRNSAVFRLLFWSVLSALKRVFYGLFIEKRWEVSLVRSGGGSPLSSVCQLESRHLEWSTLRREPEYSFYADPFFFEDHHIVVEAMCRRTGKGQILLIGADEVEKIRGFGGHVSYPAPVLVNGETLLLPEVSSWRPPALFSIDQGKASLAAELDIDVAGLLDPTLFQHNGRFYLFGNDTRTGPSILRLWAASSVTGRFEEHPASPIRTSARGSRMAGALFYENGEIFRLGQDFRRGYGDGVLLFRIVELTEERYSEEYLESLTFGDVRGPHTMNFRNGEILFDWYVERLSPFAGISRFLNRL